ncbi:MAG: glycosyltransferase, partial [Maritimibacter sp.]|nr:glycosyltransferase [Maritimibacter sp.]
MQFHYADKTITVNVATREALAEHLAARWRAGDGFALATINLDHLAKLEVDPAFVDAYAAQDFVVADGWPIVTLAKMSGAPV